MESVVHVATNTAITFHVLAEAIQSASGAAISLRIPMIQGCEM